MTTKSCIYGLIAIQEALQRGHGPTFLGSGGSRLLDGNSTYAETLENDLAKFYHAPAGLLCNSGFDANVSIFSCLPQPGDVVVFDELIHASVHDGMKLSRAAACVSFAHNCIEDLTAVLERLKAEHEGVRNGRCNVFVAIETIYSMGGDAAPLGEIVDVLRRVLDHGNGHLVVDEAHAVGVFGPQGRGVASQLGLEDQISVRLHTFGKALACSGAVILCDAVIRQYLINYARPLIYTTFMPFPLLSAIRVSHDHLRQGKTEPLVQHLRRLEDVFHSGLAQTSESLSQSRSHLLRLPEARSRSAIMCVLSSEALDLAAHCRSNGFWVRAILPPTVPAGTERVRVCLHSGNTIQEVESLLVAIAGWVAQKHNAKL